MKKCIYMVICLIMIILFSNSCSGDAKMDELDNYITAEYEISDLLNYFKDSNTNEPFNSSRKNLHYSDINERFPVELTRENGYSVYSVKEGGYYYIFWSQQGLDKNNISRKDPFVYFTAYVNSKKDISLFKQLKAGVSTAKDVKKIDPYFELTFLMSRGVFSYSIIDNERILEIEYAENREAKNYSDLIIKKLAVISRDNASSRYGTILSKDLPFNSPG